MDANQALTLTNESRIAAVIAAGQDFNHHAAAGAFQDYIERKATNTIKRQLADLAPFAAFLSDPAITADEYQQRAKEFKRLAEPFQQSADRWRGITHGHIEAYKRWMLQNGYAIRSVNVRLSTVKTYAKLAFKAGVIGHEEHAFIRAVSGYPNKETRNVDEKRATDGTATRRPGAKKAKAVSIPTRTVKALKTPHQDTDKDGNLKPITPQARRDALLMCLLLDHGLRCGEASLLTVGAVNLTERTLTFYRPKVNRTDTHKLTPDTLRAAIAYFENDAPLAADAPLLRESRKDGSLTGDGMSERAITKRVKALGTKHGIEHLSAHDCRHCWATNFAHKYPDQPFKLQEAGGWSSLAMPRWYIEYAKIAFDGESVYQD